MNIDFIIPETTGKEQTIYMPLDVYGVVVCQMADAKASFKTEDIHSAIIEGTMPIPNELYAWKNRYEADGHKYSPDFAYERLTTPYSAEYIYKYSQKFFGPTMDPDYKKMLQDNLEYNRALVEAEDDMIEGQDY